MASFYLERDLDEMVQRLSPDAERFAGRTVLLCGGAGFLGRYFTVLFSALNQRALSSNPCRVIICDNLITSGVHGAHDLSLNGFRFITHNIIEPLAIEEPLDYVIQAAGIASPYYYRKYPLETLEVATTGTQRMLSLGLSHHLKGFLFFSSSEIYGDPDARHVPTPESYRGNVSCLGPRACYDESKRLGETLCAIYHQLHGVPVKMVRPFNVYGPGMQETDYRVLPNFASRIVGGKPLHVYGHGNQTRTFCYITDAIVGFLKVLLHGTPGHAYNIGNPEPEISMRELVTHLERIVGRTLNLQLVEYPDTYPADEPQRRCPDIRKAAVQFGHAPAVSLDEGLGRFMEWALAHYTGAS